MESRKALFLKTEQLMATTRILVVDDEEDLCEILKFNLENRRFMKVDTAYSAEEALKKGSDRLQFIIVGCHDGRNLRFQDGTYPATR